MATNMSSVRSGSKHLHRLGAESDIDRHRETSEEYEDSQTDGDTLLDQLDDARPSTSARKGVAFACNGCKRRKAKCDGSFPICQRCQRMNEECVYQNSPKRTVSLRMAIQSLRSQEMFLRHLLQKPLPSIDELTRREIELHIRHSEWFPNLYTQRSSSAVVVGAQQASEAVRLADAENHGRQVEPRSDSAEQPDQDGNNISSEEDEQLDEILLHLSMDESGKVAHFGGTSLLHQAPPPSVIDRHRHRGLSFLSTQGSQAPPASTQRESVADARHIATPSPANHHQKRESSHTSSSWLLPVDRDGRYLPTPAEQESMQKERDHLRTHPTLVTSWQTLALNRLKLKEGDDADIIMHLIDTYFIWQNPGNCIVSKDLLIRDLALDGPNCNAFLLNVICSAAVRYSEIYQASSASGGGGAPQGTSAAINGSSFRSMGNLPVITGGNFGDTNGGQSFPGSRTPTADWGQIFLNRSKLLLAAEMDKPSSVPTIQGLLLLGQRECACGNPSQGWQYTGMAFRAMRDLGIHLDCNRLPEFAFGMLSAEDREIRRRLFWSAYTSDKIISLALGRCPTFNAWQNVSPGFLAQSAEDNEPWTVGANAGTPSYTTLNFLHFARLCELLERVMMRVFMGRTKAQQQITFIDRMHAALLEWFRDLPKELKIEVDNLPETCPPPHIFMTNAMYRTAWILLYKLYTPYGLKSHVTPPEVCKRAAELCTRSAEDLHRLFTLYAQTYKLQNMTYTLSYCVYAAASINAYNFHSPDPKIRSSASEMLAYSLFLLEKCSTFTPGVRKVEATPRVFKRLAAPSNGIDEDESSTKRHHPPRIPESLDPTSTSVDLPESSESLTKTPDWIHQLTQRAGDLTQTTQRVSAVGLHHQPRSDELKSAGSTVPTEDEEQQLQRVLDNCFQELNPSPSRTWDVDMLAGMSTANMEFDWNSWVSRTAGAS